MKYKKLIICILSVMLLGAILITGCKRRPSKNEVTEETSVTIEDISDCEELGSQYWEYFKNNDVIAIANISREDIRPDYLSLAERATINIPMWGYDYIVNNVNQIQIVEGVTAINENTATIEYSVLFPDFSREGALRSYHTSLSFEISEDEVITITNPEAAFELQDEILSDYAAYLVEEWWPLIPIETEEVIPEETVPPTPVPTEVPPTEPIETEPETPPAETQETLASSSSKGE